MERACRNCPAFFKVSQPDLVVTAGGWSNHKIDGRDVICCRPGTTVQKKKPMEMYSVYCLATPKGKKIGHIATWTGRTPTWCPLGREIDGQEGEADGK